MGCYLLCNCRPELLQIPEQPETMQENMALFAQCA